MTRDEAQQVLQQARMARKVIKAARPKREKRVLTAPVKPDRGRERDNGFLAFLRRQPCAAMALGGCEGRIEAAHIRFGTPDRPNPGLGRKNHDRWANPLCTKHHAEQHKGSERVFWTIVGIDPAANAQRLYAEYQLNGEVVGR